MYWGLLIATFVGSVVVGAIAAAYKRRRRSSPPKDPR